MSKIDDLRQRVEAAEKRFKLIDSKQREHSERLTGMITTLEKDKLRKQARIEQQESLLRKADDEIQQLRGMLDTLLKAADSYADEQREEALQALDSKMAALVEEAPADAAPAEDTKKEDASKDDASKDDASKDDAKKDDTTAKHAKKEDAAKDEPAAKDTKNEETSKGDSRKEEAAGEDTSNSKKKASSKKKSEEDEGGGESFWRPVLRRLGDD